MKNRCINVVPHQITGRQLLSRLIDLWTESYEPITLITRVGEADSTVRSVRIALSKERKIQRQRAVYGFTVSSIFRWTLTNGYKAEAIVIRWQQTNRQKLRYRLTTSENQLNLGSQV